MEALLLIVGCVIVFIIIKWKHKPITHQTINCYVGGLGTGKSLLSVNEAVKNYKKNVNKWKLKKLWQKLTRKPISEKPLLVSNIPIQMNNVTKSSRLTREMIEGKQRIPEKSIIMIDEISLMMSQYQYNNKEVDETKEFFTLARHFIDCEIYLTCQDISEVIKHIRTKVNVVVWCKQTKTYFKLFAITQYREQKVDNEGKTVELYEEEKDSFRRKFTWLHPRKYDTRCYSERYTAKEEPIKRWRKLKTKEIVTYNKEIRKMVD